MPQNDAGSAPPEASIPPDDPNRRLTLVNPDGPEARHVAVAGGIYTILVSGADTAGRYCLIDMMVPDGGGPPPHRHDFEEMFTLLDGELEFTFRAETVTVRTGSTVNVPANAPHAFKNTSGRTAHMLCLCSPAGQEAFFLAVGAPVDSRSTVPPKPTEAQMAETGRLVQSLLPTYRTEMVTA